MNQRQDELYYSNYCNHSKIIINYIAQNNLIDSVSCICIDKRKRNDNNHYMISLENGKQILLPPSVYDVPSLLCKSKNHTLITGSNSILAHFKQLYGKIESSIVKENGEPMAASLNTGNYYADYDTNILINTPTETYVPDKISMNITNDSLQNERKMDWNE